MFRFIANLPQKKKDINQKQETNSRKTMSTHGPFNMYLKYDNNSLINALTEKNKTNIVSGPASLQNIPVMYAFFTPVLNV